MLFDYEKHQKLWYLLAEHISEAARERLKTYVSLAMQPYRKRKKETGAGQGA